MVQNFRLIFLETDSVGKPLRKVSSEVILLECEICGAADASKKMKIENTQLVVCEKCASLGSEIGELTTQERGAQAVKSSSSSRSNFSLESEEILKRNYGSLVREVREDRGLTLKELAEKIKEKKSVVKRIENEELKPDEKLSNKLERELDVELFTEHGGENEKSDSGKDELTIGDVVKMK